MKVISIVFNVAPPPPSEFDVADHALPHIGLHSSDRTHFFVLGIILLGKSNKQILIRSNWYGGIIFRELLVGKPLLRATIA